MPVGSNRRAGSNGPVFRLHGAEGSAIERPNLSQIWPKTATHGGVRMASRWIRAGAVAVCGLGAWAAAAQEPPAQPVSTQPAVPAAQRPVAYIYGAEPVTREQLGEFLIARGGYEKVELLV